MGENALDLPGVERLRFITSYPRDFSDRMIAVFAAFVRRRRFPGV